MTERTSAALDDMPGAYTRSKMLAEQAALAAARSGFPVVIANPTMPIGPHHGNLTPPALMLQHFARRRMQIYLDCRRGPAPRHGPRRGQAALYSRWRAHPVAASRYGGSKGIHVRIPAGFAHMTAAMMEFLADHVTRRPPAATAEAIRIAARSKALSSEKSRRELGYTPRPIELTLQEAIESIPGGSRWSVAGWRAAPLGRPIQEASGL